jgi:hypothetical protein
MNPRRSHAQIHLPPLSSDYALTLVDIFERAITAIWNAHGDGMSNLQALPEANQRAKRHGVLYSGDPNAPDTDF